MNDKQLTWIFLNRLSNYNGFVCGRMVREHGCPAERYCEGSASIVNGRLKYNGTCGEPCSFICDNANALQKEIDKLQQYAKLIEEVFLAKDWLRRFVQCFDYTHNGWNYTTLHHLLDEARKELRQTDPSK